MNVSMNLKLKKHWNISGENIFYALRSELKKKFFEHTCYPNRTIIYRILIKIEQKRVSVKNG